VSDLSELISQMRQDYETQGIDPATLGDDPFDVFDVWFRGAHQSGVSQPNAMSLATVDEAGRPSVRTVLLKGFDHEGFVFYTNQSSRKGRELDRQPVAAISLTWLELHRQIRMEGTVVRVTDAEADEYFASRPRGAQLAALASDQSEVIESREELESKVEELASRFLHGVPRPSDWGGFRLSPSTIEFWQGRPSRMHDRVLFARESGTGEWTKVRLSP